MPLAGWTTGYLHQIVLSLPSVEELKKAVEVSRNRIFEKEGAKGAPLKPRGAGSGEV